MVNSYILPLSTVRSLGDFLSPPINIYPNTKFDSVYGNGDCACTYIVESKLSSNHDQDAVYY